MFAMNQPLFTDHFGHLTSNTEEWTSPRVMRDCSTPNSVTRRHGDSDTSYLQDHHQVSPFELALNYDSTINTPVSINPGSPTARDAPSSDSQWCRSNSSSLQYHQRDNDGVYILSNSIPMKSRKNSPPVHMSDAEIPISISPYIFESPSTQCPPSPYWGSFSVSGPQATATPPTPNSTPRSQSDISASSRSQAPALATAHSMNTHLAAQQNQAQQVQARQQRQTLPVKRECPASSPRTKRRKKSLSESRVSPSGPLTPPDLTEADKLLLHLKDIKEEEKWDWKDITTKFNEITKGDHKVAALQMRHTRLVERMRIWTDAEIRALTRAKQQFETTRWKTVAANMLDYGCETKWSPRACQLKWAELHPEDVDALGPTPPRPNPEYWDAEGGELGEFDGNEGDWSRNPGTGGGGGDAQGLPVGHRSNINGRSRHVPYEQQHNWAVRPQQ